MRLMESQPYRIAKQQASRPQQSRPPQRSLVLVQPPYNDMGFGPLLQTDSAILFSAKGWVGPGKDLLPHWKHTNGMGKQSILYR